MKVVILELGFEDDLDAETFADAIAKGSTDGIPSQVSYEVIECRVENP